MKKIYIIPFLLVFFVSCATYSNITTLNYENNTLYEFKNNTSESLIIIIDGSGFNSALGLKVGRKWYNLGTGYYLHRALKSEYTIIIPEKLNVQIGVDYYKDAEFRSKYTAENLIISYSANINSYLSQNSYKNVFIIGLSEGACLLPMIYEEIIDKDQITGMVSVGYGGLSRYEQVNILKDSSLDMPPLWRELFLKIDDFDNEIKLDPDSIEKTYWAYPFKWYSGFLHLRPYDYYEKIDIPLLFIHGGKDINCPVESTKYIQENLLDKPFEYIYYEDMGHGPATVKEGLKLINDGKGWVNKLLKK